MRMFFRISCFTSLSFLSYAALSQTAAQDAAIRQALAGAAEKYHRLLRPETGLYNGREYVDYAYTIQTGIPFFMTGQFTTGTVMYNNMLYQQVPLLYDIVKEEVVISNPSQLHKISLISERVSQFTIGDHLFVRLIKDSIKQSFITTGFYELLYEGKSRLYKKQTKTVQENLTTSEGVKKYIDESTNYYLEKDNVFYGVNNKASFLAAVKDKKKDMQRFLKKNNLRFKKNKEAALVKATAYYDE